MKESNVVLTNIPRADGLYKVRPVIILREFPVPYKDLLICGVSTQLHLFNSELDEIISKSDTDFHTSGVMSESLIRLSFITVLPRNKIIGTIGVISIERYERLIRKLCKYLLEKFQK